LLRDLVPRAEAVEAMRVASTARAVAGELGVDLPAPEPTEVRVDSDPEPPAFGERLVTSLFADVRGYTTLTAQSTPQELNERMTPLYRFARTEVERHFGIVDKFAGDAVMATYNVVAPRLDHTAAALRSAIGIRDKAAAAGFDVGAGIAVGPVVVGALVPGGNVSAIGTPTNLAARLQASAGGAEVLLSGEAHRRVATWLAERGTPAERHDVQLKGFDGPVEAWVVGRG
jgi:class 3 adenylate cyclase